MIGCRLERPALVAAHTVCASFRFHAFITTSTAILVCIVVGRTCAILTGHGVLFFAPIAIFTLSFVAIFGIVNLYGTNTEALEGRTELKVLCSFTLTGAISVLSYVVQHE